MHKKIFFQIVFLFISFFSIAHFSLSYSASPIRMIALGDSTTAGTPNFKSPIEAPPDGSGNPESQYVYWMMKRHPEWNVENHGVNGERSDEILRRFEKWINDLNDQIKQVKPGHVQNKKPIQPVKSVEPKLDIVIVLAGVNDLYQGHSADWVADYLKKIYELAERNGIKVIACTVLPYDRSSDEIRRRMKKVNDWIRSYSLEHHLGFCDTYHAVEDPENPGRLVSTSDGLHPDIEGYQKMGNAVTDVLEKLPV